MPDGARIARPDERRDAIARCTPRKHVVENGQSTCDCRNVTLYPTAAGNAKVITLLTTAFLFPPTHGRDDLSNIEDSLGI